MKHLKHYIKESKQVFENVFDVDKSGAELFAGKLVGQNERGDFATILSGSGDSIILDSKFPDDIIEFRKDFIDFVKTNSIKQIDCNGRSVSLERVRDLKCSFSIVNCDVLWVYGDLDGLTFDGNGVNIDEVHNMKNCNFTCKNTIDIADCNLYEPYKIDNSHLPFKNCKIKTNIIYASYQYKVYESVKKMIKDKDLNFEKTFGIKGWDVNRYTFSFANPSDSIIELTASKNKSNLNSYSNTNKLNTDKDIQKSKDGYWVVIREQY